MSTSENWRTEAARRVREFRAKQARQVKAGKKQKRIEHSRQVHAQGVSSQQEE